MTILPPPPGGTGDPTLGPKAQSRPRACGPWAGLGLGTSGGILQCRPMGVAVLLHSCMILPFLLCGLLLSIFQSLIIVKDWFYVAQYLTVGI